MTDKELNSHDLAREIEIVKLQEENEELKSQLRGTTHCFDEEEHNRLKEEITNLSKDVDMWNSKYNDMFDENKRLKEALETKSYCKYANKCDELYDCSREEYEDMANANTRLSVENYDLKKENQKLKKQLEVGEQQYNDLVEEKEKLDAENQVLKNNKNIALTYMKNYLQMELRYQNKEVAEHFKIVIYTLNRGNKHGNLVDITDYETQQKKFIRYMDNIIKNLETEDVDDEELKGYLIQKIDTFKEILNKYKEIIGVSDENNKQ